MKKLRRNFLDLVFVPHQKMKWHFNERAQVVLHFAHTSFFDKLAQRFFAKPAISFISLDEYGSLLWTSLDGKNTVSNLVEILQNKFPPEKNDMLKRVVHFLHTLQSNKFVVEK